MNIKKLNLFFLLFLFFISSNSFANISEENEQINSNEIKQEILEVSALTGFFPDINSKSAIVLDRSSKAILYGKHEHNIRKMASTTKIMTAIVVIENVNLNEIVIVSKQAANTGGSTLGIKEGDKISVCDLLYGLLLRSGNDTAVALAEHVGGSVENFAEMMNNKAKELNLINTHFVTPHGLDNDNHYTTAYELAILTDYALKNQIFSNLVKTKNYTITINGNHNIISNTNELLGNLNGIYGVKTGFTNGANRCLVTSCKRNNLDIICVVLGADSKKFRTQDSIKLIEYTYKSYQMVNFKKLVSDEFNKWKTYNLSRININKASLSESIKLELNNFNLDYYPVNKEQINNISITITCDYNLEAPVPSNTNIGKLEINIGKNQVLKFNIVNTNRIEKKNCFNYFKDFISNYFKYLTIID